MSSGKQGAAGVSTNIVNQMLIAGAFVDSLSGERIDVVNPGNRSVIASVPRGGAADVDRAVKAGTEAFVDWRRTPPRERGAALARVADALQASAEYVARTLASETGNAIRTQSRPEVAIAADIFRYFAGLGGELKGETIPTNDGVLTYTLRQPVGVVGAIVPWNAPLALAALKIAPALLCGNTVVLKASEEAPLAVLLLGSLCADHLPSGVLNVLTGYGTECGAALANHSAVAKLTFTGSTETGRAVMRAAADRIIPVSLELGGKSPSIVFPDADEDWVVDGTIAAARILRQSQSCTTGSRLFIHKRIYDSFLAKLSTKLAGMTVGDQLDERTDIGALVNERQFKRVCSFIEEGLRQPGSRAVVGGSPPQDGPLSKGYFTLPTVFAGASNGWRLAQEEIFGPVLVAIPWSDRDEVIRMANDTHFGLAAYVWTHDVGAAMRTAHQLDAGFVQVNQAAGQSPGQSYGGIKQSGIGREHSLEGMLESFTYRKTFALNVLTPTGIT